MREVSCNTSRKWCCTPGDMINAGTSTQGFGVDKSVKKSYLVSTVEEDTVFDGSLHFDLQI